MRAFVKDKFEDQGSVREVADPTPTSGEVRVRVHAASVNPMDAGAASGVYKDFMQARFPYIPGLDLSGVIDAVGLGVTEFAVGDEVFGSVRKAFFGAGSFAERVTAGTSSVHRKPGSINHEVASTAGVAAVTALAAFDAIEARPGHVIVVVGASGGVGSYLVQLLASQRARVVAVARGERAAYLRGLGASEVVDYTAGDLVSRLTASYPGGVDALADLASDKDAFATLAAQVKDSGRAVSTLGAADVDGLKKRGVVAQNVNGVATTEGPSRIVAHLAAATVKPPEIRTLPLDRAAEALAQVGGRHTEGKIVIAVF
jgi:NADPH:quinone reductase-like Zn-dependent oxidoreductase